MQRISTCASGCCSAQSIFSTIRTQIRIGIYILFLSHFVHCRSTSACFWPHKTVAYTDATRLRPLLHIRPKIAFTHMKRFETYHPHFQIQLNRNIFRYCEPFNSFQWAVLEKTGIIFRNYSRILKLFEE